ncbi:Platelet-activating factor acetylhydrolase IB subunit beta [Portunus trituberculatus]|uniref:Platelet-activating factor acetylhydrolase IB subunit beta n=1 Tax=Portunus trituberculatus TaxID=210409 RepID=A0A5B7E0I3_PORTR|nr:Platelet-activating factor acetylhydrolase IB subunit beta [Portunus trituberculatus]
MEPDVVFVGDSIVANLQCTDVWEKWFAPMHCLNFGIGGDETQHVLWRLKNGELEFIKPKAVVVLVGTNNHEHTAAEVAGGIMEICRTIREKQPQSHIVALTLLPRGEKPNCLREKNSEINGLIKETLRSIEMCQLTLPSPTNHSFTLLLSLDGEVCYVSALTGVAWPGLVVVVVVGVRVMGFPPQQTDEVPGGRSEREPQLWTTVICVLGVYKVCLAGGKCPWYVQGVPSRKVSPAGGKHPWYVQGVHSRKEVSLLCGKCAQQKEGTIGMCKMSPPEGRHPWYV